MNDELLKLGAAAERDLGAAAGAADPLGTDQPAGDQGEGPTDTPPISNAQVVTGTVAMMREIFCMYTKLESPRRVINDQRTIELGGVWGPVCDKHGINLQEWLGDYFVEATAVMVTFTILGEVRAAVQAEQAAKKAEQKPQPETVDG